MVLHKVTNVPPVQERDAFAGLHYDDLNEFENEYKTAVADWEDFPNRRFKARGIVTCLCLNTEIDPEDWREDLAKDVAVARREGHINAWDVNDNFDNELPPQDIQYRQIQETLKRNYIDLAPRVLQNNTFHWKLLHNSDAYKQKIFQYVDNMVRITLNRIGRVEEQPLICFHYNGHDVPRPTENGEIWVFSRNMTQYHPLNVPDELATKIGSGIYIWDCCNAGLIIEKFNKKYTGDGTNFHFAACARDEFRPIKRDVPADIFTACLTNPIKTTLKWALGRDIAKIICPDISPVMIDRYLPDSDFGEKKDRKTLHGELGWIMTGLLEAIAWDSMAKNEPKSCRKAFKLFHDGFRCDSLLSALYRNFLIADRIMRSYGCNPECSPPLPKNMHTHPMWKLWDSTVDRALTQLQKNLKPDPLADVQCQSCFLPSLKETHLEFYDQCLNSFENLIQLPSYKRDVVDKPPIYLPLALQSILEQAPRLKALSLFARYMDTCPSAIYNTLAAGLNQEQNSYLMRLLDGLAYNKQPHFWMVFIWTKLIVFQNKVIGNLWRPREAKDKKNKAFTVPMEYFFQVLFDSSQETLIRAMSAFVIARICEEKGTPSDPNHEAKEDVYLMFTVNQSSTSGLPSPDYLYNLPLFLLNDDGYRPNQGDPLLRKWLLILTGRIWEDYPDAFQRAFRGDHVETSIMDFIRGDEDPLVRAAAVYAIGTYIGCEMKEKTKTKPGYADETDPIHKLTLIASELSNSRYIDDACWLVRREIVCSLQLFIVRYYDKISKDFQKIVSNTSGKRRVSIGTIQNYRVPGNRLSFQSPQRPQQTVSAGHLPIQRTTKPVDKTPKDYFEELSSGVFLIENPIHNIALAILKLAMDPHNEVARDAKHLFDIVFKQQGRRKSSGQSHVRQNSGQLQTDSRKYSETINDSDSRPRSDDSVGSQPKEPIQIKVNKSTFFKYASKDWLRSQLKQEPKIPLNLYVNTLSSTERQREFDRAHELSEDVKSEHRNRSRSKPQNRDQQVEQSTHIFNASRNHNKRILERSKMLFSTPIDNLRQLVHFGEVDEKINTLTFLPYNEALVATGQSGIYLVDFGYLPSEIQDGDTRNAQSRVIATDKGVALTSMTVLNQGTSTIVATASTDGCVKLRKLRRSLEGRLEIQDSVLTSWRIAPLGKHQDIKLAWDETYLACSFQERNTAVVTLWDGLQERRVHRVAPVALENIRVTCMAVMGDEGLKTGDLIIGTDDGGLWKMDTRSDKYGCIKFGERTNSRGISKNKVIGLDTSQDKILTGYSDGSVKVWDIRKSSKELEKYTYAKRDTKNDWSNTFAGSIKYDYFAHNLRADLFVRRKNQKENEDVLLDPCYPFRSASRLFMYHKPDPKITHPSCLATHPFNPFLAVATRPGESGDLKPGVISVWMPRKKRY